MADLDFTQALKDYGAIVAANTPPKDVEYGTHPFVMLPPGYTIGQLHALIYNDYAERPHRAKQAVTLLDPDSLIEYWALFHDPNSRIFGDRDAHRFHAVLDYHEPGNPRWGSHTATLQLEHTEEWTTWTESNDKPMAQAAMALFIEDNAPDVIKPAVATMLEVARTLEANETSAFDSAVRLDNGDVRLAYRKDTTATAGGGTLQVPERFTIAIPIFEGMGKVEIEARLRYRISGGKLSMWYSLWRHAAAERKAFDAVMEQVREACGVVLIGKP
jgi:uncharacterized protein YfdQ (DUF2303 family)